MYKTLTVCLAAVLAAGAAQAEIKPFKVNGEQVTVAEQKFLYENAVKRGAKKGAELEAAVKNAVIEQRVLAQAAKKAKLERQNDVKLRIDNQRQSILASAALEDWIKKNPAKEADVRNYYNKAKAAYGDTEYKVRHIQVKTEAEAKKVIEDLADKKASFEELAKLKSTDRNTGEKGGDLGWVVPYGYPPAFGAAFTVLKPGTVAQVPIRTDAGWQVVRLDETRKAQNFPAYETQKAMLTDTLTRAAAQKHFAELVKNAKIEE